MILDQSKVILIHLQTKQKLKRHQLIITPKTRFEQLKKRVKQLYKITDNEIDLLVEQERRMVALNQQNFQYYKQTVHINKIIKVVQYDIMSLTHIEPFLKLQEQIKELTQISEKDLKPISWKELETDCSSFLADDLLNLFPFLQNMCTIKPQTPITKQEKLSLELIGQMANSIKPIIEKFYSSPEILDKINYCQ